MKKLAVVLLGLTLGMTGCLTPGMIDAIDKTVPENQGRTVAKVVILPVTAIADVALLPVYVVGAPLAFVALTSGMGTR